MTPISKKLIERFETDSCYAYWLRRDGNGTLKQQAEAARERDQAYDNLKKHVEFLEKKIKDARESANTVNSFAQILRILGRRLPCRSPKK